MGMLEMPVTRHPVVDCFGAPEFVVNGFDISRVAEGMARLSYWSAEPEGRILRVKVLFPVVDMLAARAQVTAYFNSRGDRVQLM